MVWHIALVVLSNIVYQVCAKSVPKEMNAMASMIMRYTDAETAVFSVVNGVICSAFVPILFSICY